MDVNSISNSSSYDKYYDMLNARKSKSENNSQELTDKKLEYSKENDKNDQQKLKQIQELKNIDEKVKAHEMAHVGAGGGFAGSPSFEYTTGPDGKQYAIGGEVPITIKTGSTPQETIQNMERVKAAALAPADPSGQDRAIAAKAAAIAMKAAQEMATTEDGKGQNVSVYA